MIKKSLSLLSLALITILNAQPNVSQNSENLLDAAIKDQTDDAMYFINRGDDVNMTNEYGSTPLHEAAFTNNTKLMNKLLEKNAHINAVNKDGQTPLIIAAQHGKKEAVETLLNYKPNIDVRDKGGKTALHWAVMNFENAIVIILLSKGANPNNIDEYNQSTLNRSIPSMIAIIWGAREYSEEKLPTLGTMEMLKRYLGEQKEHDKILHGTPNSLKQIASISFLKDILLEHKAEIKGLKEFSSLKKHIDELQIPKDDKESVKYWLGL